MARVLLVDDDPAMLFATRAVVRASGHETVQAQSGAEALQKLEGVDLVVTDFAMPKMDGIELLEAIRQREPGLPVLLLTAHGSEKVAVRAIKAGAYDYVTKPFDVDELAAVVERALEMQSLRLRNRRLEAEKAIGKSFVADSPSMTRLLEVVSRIAPKDITVLVRGETGTGKEIISSLLHAQSRRAAGPLVRFNCAAIPAELADAELFGHTKGAFTGATQGRRGFFAEANGGTIVLDEIGELPLALQPKLLRVLQEGEIQPVGAGRVEKVDVRVVASTNRDLLGEAHLGRFRSDLYYRLAVLEVVVPPPARAPRGHPRPRRRVRPAPCAALRPRARDALAGAGRQAAPGGVAGQRAAAREHDRAAGRAGAGRRRSRAKWLRRCAAAEDQPCAARTSGCRSYTVTRCWRERGARHAPRSAREGRRCGRGGVADAV